MQILLIDDDIDLCELLSEYLGAHGFSVTAEHDGEAGLTRALKDEFALILLDVMLPKLDGFEVLKKFRQQKLTPLIMLTARGEDFDRIFGLELGADDYLAKPFNHRELLARVKAISRRIEHINSLNKTPSMNMNNVKICPKSREIFANNERLTLTGTEYEILVLLVKNVNEVISKDEISQQVLGRRLVAFDRSIDMHVSNIRKKIAISSPGEKIKTIRGSGYIFISGE
ncbi:response regulator [Pseudoalteromonas denitrificans]|uniref:Two-component system, OmpR family, response regulator CpxR n=1 Tax=Pseudoalteromonas denitrificans DSM 6059 TaxID=1123010 RepID=A0A1I1NZL3_9GAMM|nr:response regulator [Pseudoalteromonas denitrificans]SFD02772.1 two-component system, OmpR family, response regulator CpxR [Pseudoalteromonas denitrificans DSM 6059]